MKETTIYYNNGEWLAKFTKNADGKYVGDFCCYWFNGNLCCMCTYAMDGSEKRVGTYEYWKFEGGLYKKGSFDENGEDEEIYFSLNPLDKTEKQKYEEST
jgi:uncharacterized Fe-S cluster-containing MiaB family protein